MDKEKFQGYLEILNNELQVALGCTEPIAIAFASATAKKVLKQMPEKIVVEVCGNIIKNAKSVVVPNTNGLKGIKVAVIAGLFCDNVEDKLQILSSLKENAKEEILKYLELIPIEVKCSASLKKLYIDLTIYNNSDKVNVVISDSHTNITSISKNDKVIYSIRCDEAIKEICANYSLLDVKSIIEFADTCNLDDIKDKLEKQIEYNYQIALKGLNGNYGANIGKVLLHSYGSDVKIKAQAYAAAASDARMSGCEAPVVIISGSGNQGITCSVPLVVYALEKKCSHEKLLRALIVSDLITIHQKTGIGKLSAFCGAVCAGCGAAAGIAYLMGSKYEVISHTITNTLGITSGLVCDGAKPSCASKIATAIYGGILGFEMYNEGQEFVDGDGLIKKGVDNTIANIGRLAREGMDQTDKEILKLMTENQK